jgi:hypothetical protein
MKTPEGEVKVAVLGDSPGPEEYLQHISSFVRMLERKKISDDLLKQAKAVASLKAPVRRLTTAPAGEKPADKTVRLEKLEAAVNALVEANVHEDAKLDNSLRAVPQDPEGRSRVAMGSHRERYAHQGSLGGSEGCEARRYPQEVKQIPLGVHRFP